MGGNIKIDILNGDVVINFMNIPVITKNILIRIHRGGEDRFIFIPIKTIKEDLSSKLEVKKSIVIITIYKKVKNKYEKGYKQYKNFISK